jgi:hypothetical protein
MSEYKRDPIIIILRKTAGPSSGTEARIFKRLWSPGIDSAANVCLGGRYDNPIPPRFLAPIDCLKIPALHLKVQFTCMRMRILAILLYSVILRDKCMSCRCCKTVLEFYNNLWGLGTESE